MTERPPGPADPLATIGGYTVLRRLGAGGMGEVYLVQHPRLPRQDALKLLAGGVVGDADAKARFLREADVLSGLSHPNIVHLYDRGEDDGRLWLTMEYIDGADAARLLREHGPMPVDLALRVVDGVGSALDYGHRMRGVTHRDVKPANILIGFEDGAPASVKLTDFGIAKALEDAVRVTSTGLTIGTMSYLAPEAIEGGTVDHRSDQYSLACTAFELLSGTGPYPRESARAVAAAHLTAPVPLLSERAPHLGRAADAVVARALAKEPGDRYPDNAEFVADLRAALASAPRHAPVPPTTPPPAAPTAPAFQYAPTHVPAASAAPRAAVPTAAGPAGARRSRRGLLIGGAVAATVLIAAGVAGAVVLSRDERPSVAAGASNPAGSTVACDFADSPDQAGAARTAIASSRAQIDKLKATLNGLSAADRSALQAQIDSAEQQNVAMEKALPALETLTAKNKTIGKPSGTAVPSTGSLFGSITTSAGTLSIELDRAKAPCNVRTFETLIAARFFDGTTCHRETDAPSASGTGGLYVLQCGDPSASGLGGAGWTSPDEKPTFLTAAAGATGSAATEPAVIYPAGTIAVANANGASGHDTGSSQFFLVYRDSTLPATYSVIGRTNSGGIATLLDIAKKGITANGTVPASSTGTVTDGKPTVPVTISTMAVSP
ncbi:protein kinase [Tsukamurella sp. NPDC003166]|uniref:protein kinase domain-containing protein n=1 Tax=Tsukamurella sp. NPDC003166 TaxID=3154444 RepID=UPI0033B2C1E8